LELNMACVDTLPGTVPATSSGFERVRYFPRQLLTADDMRIEQEYFRDKQRRHNRFLHGWGIVCGLEVKPNSIGGPLAVHICPGYALGPCGDEIYVPEPVPFDLGECIRRPADPCSPQNAIAKADGPPATIVVSIRYAECPTRPLRTLPAGCGCDDTACEYSRIRDGFEIRCRPKAEKPIATLEVSICDIEKNKNKFLPPLPEPPSDPWLDLAAVTMQTPKDSSTLDVSSIDNAIRRLVYSSVAIQHQVIACCCHAKK
jgi:hypothetical protein